MIAHGCDPPVTVAATSTYVGGAMIGYVAPTTVNATSAVGSPICPIIGSGVTTVAGYSVTSEGAPWARRARVPPWAVPI